jgi:hypothetical protein
MKRTLLAKASPEPAARLCPAPKGNRVVARVD